MDFSSIGNSIKKGAASITDGVKKGANTFSESISQKSKIDAAEKNIAAIFKEIGEKFYEENALSAPEGYADLIAAVNDNKKIISEAKAALDNLNAQPKCPSCGADVRKGSAFCTSCGAKLEKEPAPEEADEGVCPVCKEKVDADAAFCPNCGAKLKENQ